jgi:hypothetical protein
MLRRFSSVIFMMSLAFSLSVSTSQAAKIYHWVDEKGQPHYSENPPREIQAQELNVRAAGTGSAASASSSTQAPAKKTATKSEDSEKQGLTAEHSPEDKAKYCQQSRTLMQQMSENTQRRFEQPDGSYRKLTPAEIDDYRAQAQAGIESYCN